MANPVYGTIYDKTLPTVGVHWVGKPDAVTRTYISVASNSTREVGIGTTSTQKYKLRIAYQWRKRYTPSSDWDGETTWTPWQNDAGVEGGWTQLWSGATGATPTSYQTIKGVRERCTALDTFEFDYDISTYDAIQYRFRSWFIVVSGSTVRYGDYTQYNRYVVYNPPLGTISAVIDPSTDKMAISFSPNYPRGYDGIQISKVVNAAGKTIAINSLTGNDPEKNPNIRVINTTNSRKIYNAGMTFKIYAHVIHDYPSAFYGDWVRTVTATFKPRSETMARPEMSFSDTDDLTTIMIQDDSYEAVEITATWGTNEISLTPELIDDEWIVRWDAPLGVEVNYTSGAYIYAGELIAEFSDSTATHTLPNSYKSIFTSSEGTVWLSLTTNESRDTANDTETITMANGDTISRHGNANVNTRSFSGEILSVRHTYETQWLDVIEFLESPVDWVYRNPLGDRVPVAINSVRRSQTTIWDVLAIDVALTEVAWTG